MSTLKQLASKFLGHDSVFARRTAGGIQPPPFKEHSLRSRIMSTPIPPQLTIPIGPESSGEITRLVDIADQVLKYQKLAVISFSAKGRSDVPVHAPTSGVITSIENSIVADHSQQQLRHSGGGPRGGGVPPAARQTPESSGEKKSIVVDPCLCGRAPWRWRSSVAWARMAAASWGGGGSVGEA